MAQFMNQAPDEETRQLIRARIQRQHHHTDAQSGCDSVSGSPNSTNSTQDSNKTTKPTHKKMTATCKAVQEFVKTRSKLGQQATAKKGTRKEDAQEFKAAKRAQRGSTKPAHKLKKPQHGKAAKTGTKESAKHSAAHVPLVELQSPAQLNGRARRKFGQPSAPALQAQHSTKDLPKHAQRAAQQPPAQPDAKQTIAAGTRHAQSTGQQQSQPRDAGMGLATVVRQTVKQLGAVAAMLRPRSASRPSSAQPAAHPLQQPQAGQMQAVGQQHRTGQMQGTGQMQALGQQDRSGQVQSLGLQDQASKVRSVGQQGWAARQYSGAEQLQSNGQQRQAVQTADRSQQAAEPMMLDETRGEGVSLGSQAVGCQTTSSNSATASAHEQQTGSAGRQLRSRTRTATTEQNNSQRCGKKRGREPEDDGRQPGEHHTPLADTQVFPV